MLGVHEGPRRGGRRGGFLGCKAVNPAPMRSRKVGCPGRRGVAMPEDPRVTGRDALTEPPELSSHTCPPVAAAFQCV